MLSGGSAKLGSNSLMQEYSALVGDAVLRQRTRAAEHRARIEIDLANKVKSEFVSNMSHELRTPLNTVIGFSKLLSGHARQRLPDADVVQYATLIHDAAEHLLSVINDILDITKMQAGKYTLDAEEIGIDEVLQACLAQSRQIAADAGVNVRERVAYNLPPVRGDAAKLKQVFSNLISNAIKFTPKDGNVIVNALEHGHGGVCVSVRDTGIGMTEDEVRIALTPFGQVDGARTRWREGAGLGLPIAKALVELHGGELMITSIKGQGTDATVILPPRQRVSLAEVRDAMFGHGLGA
jgi:two-component system cell cycle sensor histidine kinase PleC